MSINLIYLIAGAAMFLAAVLPSVLDRYAVSAAMVLLLLGMAIGLLPLPEGMRLDPVVIRPQVERVTEFTILVAAHGCRPRHRPLVRLAQPCLVGRVVADVAPAGHRDAPDDRVRGPARLGARDRAGCRPAPRGRPLPDRPRAGQRRPGRGTTRRHPRHRRHHKPSGRWFAECSEELRVLLPTTTRHWASLSTRRTTCASR